MNQHIRPKSEHLSGIWSREDLHQTMTDEMSNAMVYAMAFAFFVASLFHL